MPSRSCRKRIVLTTVGSLGDLHPFIAVGLGLRQRGHEAVIATCEFYQRRVEDAGLDFRPLRPNAYWMTDPAVMRRMMALRKGTERAIREVMLPALRMSYEDTLAAAQGADLLVSHVITYATRLVAERKQIAWASLMITPSGLLSAYDPSLLPGYPGISKRLLFFRPRFWGPLGRFLKWMTRSWAAPLDRFRAEIGLPSTKDNPLMDGHSPKLLLATFSSLLAAKQVDWPPQSLVTGFPSYDQVGSTGLSPPLARFLDEGSPPIVFTLGSSAVMDAGAFFGHSVAAAIRLGRRAVLIVGKESCNRPVTLPEGVVAFEYAPFSQIFPRAAVNVHAGGIGTTGLAMWSGRPMLVMPYAPDQPDNAERVARLGIARTIPRRRYSAGRAAAELYELLDNPSYAQRAAEIGVQVRQEDGVGASCAAIEKLLFSGSS
jgi:rhamnosyltransferase subunit B